MDQSQNVTEQPSAPQAQSENTNGVSFPTVAQPKKKSGAKTALLVVAIIIIAILGYVIFKSSTDTSSGDNGNSGITPIETFEPEPTLEPSPTASPKAVDKADIKIQILNGTGITGEAGYLEAQLKKLDFADITAGNATDQTATATKVVFSTSLDQSIVDEITAELKKIYTSVTTSTSSAQSSDVVITTGVRKGAATTTPSATSTSTSTSTPTATATP